MQAYVPIARGYLIAAAIYYCLISASHPFYENGAASSCSDGLSIVAAGYGLVVWLILGRGQTSGRRLEALVFGMNALFLANVIAYQAIHFEPQKLVYFVLMALVFATSAPTRRVAFVSVGAGDRRPGLDGPPRARRPDQPVYVHRPGRRLRRHRHVDPDARRRGARGPRPPGQRRLNAELERELRGEPPPAGRDPGPGHRSPRPPAAPRPSSWPP
jgi:hypothetical protein